jgi:FlaG/FlaF family flagellin (archaellin)
VSALNNRKAVSGVFSVLLLVIIIFVVGIFLYSFTMGMFTNLTSSSSNSPFSLRIENVNINDTCMTIYIGNTLNQDVKVTRVYINSQPTQILSSTATIFRESTGKVQVVGTYSVGNAYDIKVVFDSGNSLITYVRY